MVGLMTRSAVNPKKVSACDVAIRILAWLAPFGRVPGKVNVPVNVPAPLNTVMAWPPTKFWPAAYIWMTTYCAFGDTAVPGKTSTTFIRWNVASAGADAASSPAAHAVAMSLRSMFHTPGLKVGRAIPLRALLRHPRGLPSDAGSRRQHAGAGTYPGGRSRFNG